MAIMLVAGLRRCLIDSFSWLHRTVLYASHGRLLNMLLGRKVLLLTTTGRKSGRRRTRPLIYYSYDDAYVVVASYGGNPSHPAWYRNLKVNPVVQVQVGNKRFTAKAETVDPELRAILWPKLVAMWRGYRSYQSSTDQEIPVVILRGEGSKSYDEATKQQTS